MYLIKIKTDGPTGERCHNECPFFDASYIVGTGKCLLFNEVLRPKRRYGDVEYWEACRQCHHVVSRLEDE